MTQKQTAPLPASPHNHEIVTIGFQPRDIDMRSKVLGGDGGLPLFARSIL